MSKRTIEEFNEIEDRINESLSERPPITIQQECQLIANMTKLQEAHRTMDKLRASIATHRLGNAQIIMLEHFVRACIPMIYRGCSAHNEAGIMKYNKVNIWTQYSTVYGFRQMGKSEALVILICCLLINVKNITIGLFANNKEATGKNRGLSGRSHDMLTGFYGYDKDMFDTDNAMLMKFKISTTDIRKVYSYSSNGDGYLKFKIKIK
jgi:hypothetical protein